MTKMKGRKNAAITVVKCERCRKGMTVLTKDVKSNSLFICRPCEKEAEKNDEI